MAVSKDTALQEPQRTSVLQPVASYVTGLFHLIFRRDARRRIIGVQRLIETRNVFVQTGGEGRVQGIRASDHAELSHRPTKRIHGINPLLDCDLSLGCPLGQLPFAGTSPTRHGRGSAVALASCRAVDLFEYR